MTNNGPPHHGGGPSNRNNHNNNNNYRNNGNNGNRNNRTRKHKDNNCPRHHRFVPHGGSRGQTCPFETVKEELIQHVQATLPGGQDIAKCIKDMKLLDLTNLEPQRTLSSNSDEKKRDLEQKGLDIKYHELLKRYYDRKDNLEKGLAVTCSILIADFCTDSMRARLQQHPDFATKLEDKPIASLEAIKVLTYDSVRAQYPFSSMTNALRDLLNCKQADNESLNDFIKRFKQLKDVVQGYLGENFLDSFIINSSKCKAATFPEQHTMKISAFENWASYLVTQSCDCSKCGTLISGFKSQCSLGHDQHPKTITAAVDALSNHRYDQKYYDNRQRQREKQMRETQDDGNLTSFAQQRPNAFCFVCGNPNHTSNNCPQKGIPQSEWHVTKLHQEKLLLAQQQQNQNGSGNDYQVDTPDGDAQNRRSGEQPSRNVQWSHFQQCVPTTPDLINAHQNGDDLDDLDNVLILDTGSSFKATINSPNLVTDIKPSPCPVGMKTNAGQTTLTMQATVPGFCDDGEAWFDPNQPARKSPWFL